MLSNNKISSIIFVIIFSLPNFSASVNDRADTLICANQEDECTFEVSNSFPISPMIPASFPSYSILSDYRYIYLVFSIPEKQKKKTFYLEAYDISGEKTIISNGDCYYIDTNENNVYEIQIFNKLNDDSFLRFSFLGLDKNFKMTVTISFNLNPAYYSSDIKLKKDNSLKKANVPELKKIVEEIKLKKEMQKERMLRAKEIIAKFLNYFLDTTISFESGDDYSFSETISYPYITITVSAVVGLEISIEDTFKTEEYIISTTTVNKKVKEINSEGVDLIEKKMKMNVDNKAIGYINLYKKLVNGEFDEIFYSEGVENENYSIIFSSNLLGNKHKINIRFFTDFDDYQIYNEIEIKIEFENYTLGLQFQEVVEKCGRVLEKASKPILGGIVFFGSIFGGICIGGNLFEELIQMPIF